MPYLQDIADILFHIGLDIAGAAALFGAWFALHARYESFITDHWKSLTVTMMAPMLFGVLLSAIAWFMSATLHPYMTFAQEAVPFILPAESEIKIIQTQFLFVLLVSLTVIIGFLYIRFRTRRTWMRFEIFYILVLIETILTTMVPILVTGGNLGMFMSTIQFSKILTVGTLFCMAFLFLRARMTQRNEKTIYTFFRHMSDVFWFGIAISFFSVLFILPNLDGVGSVFYAVQTITALGIIGFAILSGPLLSKMIASRNSIFESFPKTKSLIVTLLGTFIGVSLLAASVFDGFELLELRYAQLMMLYGITLSIGLLIAIGVETICRKYKWTI